MNFKDSSLALVAALDRHDLDAAMKLVTPDFRMYWAGEPDMVKSRDEYRKHWEEFYKDHPSTRIKIRKMVEDNEMLAAEFVMTYASKEEQRGRRTRTRGRSHRVEVSWAAFCHFDSDGLLKEARLENARTKETRWASASSPHRDYETRPTLFDFRRVPAKVSSLNMQGMRRAGMSSAEEKTPI